MDQLVQITKSLCTSMQQQQKLHEERNQLIHEQLEQMQNQLLKQQENFEKLLTNQVVQERGSRIFSAEGISNSLSEFHYDPDNGMTFPAYYRRYESIFSKRCLLWSDEEKVTLLLQKLSSQENTKYTNLILPNKPEEISFDETIKTLSKIFDERDSLFHTRYKCLNIVKLENEDFVSYAGTVNSQCELFKINEISKDMFKCLIFVQGLTAPKDKDIRSRILTIMEQDPEITLQKVTEECQRLINVKRDNSHIEEKNISQVQRIKQRVPKSKEKNYQCKACGVKILQEVIVILKISIVLNAGL